MKYPFAVFQTQVEDHIFWIAKSTILKGCVGQGESQEEAIKELNENEEEWLNTAQEVGIPIPEIPIEMVQEYSGKLTLRVAPTVHKQAALIAKKEGISLNQYINDAIVAHNSEFSTINYVSKRLSGMMEQFSQCFLRYQSGTKSESFFSVSFPTQNLQNIYRPSSLAKS
jgi:hypothetical protein